MENSLNSSGSEPTVSGVKSIFKKPARNMINAFEVSLNESITVGIQNKSDLDSTTQKVIPFKKPRPLNQESFSVSSEESLVNSDLEQSNTFVKPQSLFNAKKQTFNDPFHVSFNETNTSVTNQDVQSKSVTSVDEDDSTTFFNKSNPFKRKNQAQNEVSKEGHLEISAVGDQSVETPDVNESEPNFTFGNTSISGVDSTTFMTKPNPFTKTKSKNDSVVREQLLQMSYTEENISKQTPDTNHSAETSRLNNTTKDNLDSSNKKQNLFKKKELSTDKQNQIQVSLAEDESDVELSMETNVLISEPKRSLGNLSFDKSASKLTNKSNNSGLYLDQSSINDENLNHWMSDHSDEEMPPPSIPAIPSKPSPIMEIPAENDNPPVQTNTQPSWEEKFQEIISKSRKGVQPKNSNIQQQSKPIKKPEMPLHQSNKYKPPKLNKPAAFATKRLYQYLIHKLEPKFGIDAIIEAEQLVSSISDVVKKVTRRKTHQKKLIQDLKKEMASMGIIETTVDFYEFVIKFLPYSFRVKIVPCVQPVTNTVYPPKESVNPFDKIL